MKRITISYTDKGKIWINNYPEVSLNAPFRRMVNFLIESKSLGLDQNYSIEISRPTVKREMRSSV